MYVPMCKFSVEVPFPSLKLLRILIETQIKLPTKN